MSQPLVILTVLLVACSSSKTVLSGSDPKKASTAAQGTAAQGTAAPACDPGFERKDGRCVDIDECGFVATPCGTPLAKCANKPGGYECTCPRGYAGGGPLGITCSPRIVTGLAGTCVLPESRGLKCWGARAGGVFAGGDPKVGTVEPEYLIDTEWAVGAAIGSDHGCVVEEGGTVACWGNNADGQLGEGTQRSMPIPRSVRGLEGAVAVGVGFNHSCALVRSGEVFCWGSNRNGELGDPSAAASLTPRRTPLKNVVGITIHGFASCALIRDGSVHCWGYDAHAQLGQGTTSSPDKAFAPTAVPKLDRAIAISLGVEMGLALRAQRDVVWWGIDEIGTDDTTTYEEMRSHIHGVTPMKLPSPALAVAAAGTSAYVLTQDGRIWAQGVGPLGDGTKRSSTTPIEVVGINDAIALAANALHACALSAKGGVLCWGTNWNKRLGVAKGLESLRPVSAGAATVWVGKVGQE